jgi:hypothetical protein
MHKIILTLSIVSLSLSTTIWAQSKASTDMKSVVKRESLAIGKQLPHVNSKCIDVVNNQAVQLENMLNDNGLLVVFTCNTCPFVIKNQERTNKVLEFAKSKDLNVVFLNSNEAQRDDADHPDNMLKYAKTYRYPNYVIDENAAWADAFGASHTPEVFLFDGKTRELVYKGAMDDSPGDASSVKENYLINAITQMREGKAISPNVTKSVGCSIKRLKK